MSSYLKFPSIAILYGSETGHAEECAKSIEEDAKSRGFKVACEELDLYPSDDLETQKMIIFVISTCGEGEFPGNACDTWDVLSDEDNSSDTMKQVTYCVFGLGDSSYCYFCEAAKKLDKRLSELGASRLLPLRCGNDMDDEGYETQLGEFLPELWGALGSRAPPRRSIGDPLYTVEITSTENELNHTLIAPRFEKVITMTKNSLLTPSDYEREVRHYQFQVKESNLKVGQSIGIYPHNKEEDVLEFLNFYKIIPTSVFSITPNKRHRLKYRLEPSISAFQLFTQILDIFGKPSRRFLTHLSAHCTSDDDRQKIEHLMSLEGKEKYMELIRESTTYADFFKMFPSSRPSVNYLIEMLPTIRSRAYSIASSPRVNPDFMDLCVVSVSWKKSNGEIKMGLCTSYLARCTPNTKILATTRATDSGLPTPYDSSVPFIMVALGTGYAPFRGHLQDRLAVKQSGKTVGPTVLYVGCRHQCKDYLYAQEIENFKNQGVLTLLRCAFSRDQEKKVYVQDKMKEDEALLVEYLYKKKGYFYMCGPSRSLPLDIQDAIINAFINQAGLTKDQALKEITEMKTKRRYVIKAWS